MRKYKNFKRWVFTTKLNIPPKDKYRVKEQATPHPRQQASIKMIEAPITHKSPSFICFLAMRG